MLLIIARILAIIFTVLVVSKSYLSYREGKENLTMTLFWTITWGVIVILTIFPDITDKIVPSSGGIGTILGIGLIFLYFIIYRVYIKADRIEKQLAKLVRSVSESTQKD